MKFPRQTKGFNFRIGRFHLRISGSLRDFQISGYVAEKTGEMMTREDFMHAVESINGSPLTERDRNAFLQAFKNRTRARKL